MHGRAGGSFGSDHNASLQQRKPARYLSRRAASRAARCTEWHKRSRGRAPLGHAGAGENWPGWPSIRPRSRSGRRPLPRSHSPRMYRTDPQPPGCVGGRPGVLHRSGRQTSPYGNRRFRAPSAGPLHARSHSSCVHRRLRSLLHSSWASAQFRRTLAGSPPVRESYRSIQNRVFRIFVAGRPWRSGPDRFPRSRRKITGLDQDHVAGRVWGHAAARSSV